jgi:hypothetical protein
LRTESPPHKPVKEAEITIQTYCRWRKEYGGLKLDQAKRLKELERENTKLKPVVAELSLEKQVLKSYTPCSRLGAQWRRSAHGCACFARRDSRFGITWSQMVGGESSQPA